MRRVTSPACCACCACPARRPLRSAANLREQQPSVERRAQSHTEALAAHRLGRGRGERQQVEGRSRSPAGAARSSPPAGRHLTGGGGRRRCGRPADTGAPGRAAAAAARCATGCASTASPQRGLEQRVAAVGWRLECLHGVPAGSSFRSNKTCWADPMASPKRPPAHPPTCGGHEAHELQAQQTQLPQPAAAPQAGAEVGLGGRTGKDQVLGQRQALGSGGDRCGLRSSCRRSCRRWRRYLGRRRSRLCLSRSRLLFLEHLVSLPGAAAETGPLRLVAGPRSAGRRAGRLLGQPLLVCSHGEGLLPSQGREGRNGVGKEGMAMGARRPPSTTGSPGAVR